MGPQGSQATSPVQARTIHGTFYKKNKQLVPHAFLLGKGCCINFVQLMPDNSNP